MANTLALPELDGTKYHDIPEPPSIIVNGSRLYRCDHKLNGVDPKRDCAYCMFLVRKSTRATR